MILHDLNANILKIIFLYENIYCGIDNLKIKLKYY
jgi:hypothetical protein